MFRLGRIGLLLLAGVVIASARAAEERPYGIETRTAWTTGRVTGSPEMPPPYQTERAFPKLKFDAPLEITMSPGNDRLYVMEQMGKIFSVPNNPACEKADLFIDLKKEILTLDKAPDCKAVEAAYGMEFHPDFQNNRYCYICYVLTPKVGGKESPVGTRVSRFTVTKTDPPRADPKSEVILIDWLGGGHNGGCLKFGPDGYLYISSGDGASPNPPDVLTTGQDISDLLSSILRIDVDHPVAGKAYAVPADNPFVKLAGARPEVWAYGFRNPWKMSFDRATGNLWVGDVGWELFEMVYRVERGGNYGWSIMEGPQPVRLEEKRGPTPILPPVLALPHSESSSITGGFVYHGKKLPGLANQYIFGDWETRKLWAAKCDGEKLLPKREIAQTEERIVGFCEDHEGELYVLNYEGTLHRIVANDATSRPEDFPRKLSETGLFSSRERHVPAAGVVPFWVNVEMWADHATAERFVALPGSQSIAIREDKRVYPKDSVLMKTLSLEMEAGKPSSRRFIESQILHFDGRRWQGYSYAWNEQQTDAVLVDASGAEKPLTIVDAAAPGGRREQNWHFHSRADCARCHNPWTDVTLAFTPSQLDLVHEYGKTADNQLRTLAHIGILPATKPNGTFVNPHDLSADLNARARSYLQVNCSHCHRMGGGGSAMIDVRYELDLKKTFTIGQVPSQGNFGLTDASVIAPGQPYRSVLLYRMSKQGRGRMPHIGSNEVDLEGIGLIENWIGAMEPDGTFNGSRELVELLGIQLLAKTETITDQASAQINELLLSTSGALRLMRSMDAGIFPAAIRKEIIARGYTLPLEAVRDLFERFVPPDQRIKRLGTAINTTALLAMHGDAERGRKIFFEQGGGLCRQCHQIAGQGEDYGPDLSHIATKYKKDQILENILQPSKAIEAKYVVYLVKTKTGDDYTGFLISQSGQEVVLKDPQKKEVHIPAGDIKRMLPQAISAMPEFMLSGLTAQQAADLLEFLGGLK
jgi:uncharacterized repeat protein (TIGR03806 family)